MGERPERRQRVPRPRPLRRSAPGPGRRCGAERRQGVRQRRRPGQRAGDAGRGPGSDPDQHQPARAGRAAAPSGHHRRQLCRPGVRPDLPPLRRRGDRGRDGAPPDPARGPRGLRHDPADPRGRGDPGPARRRMHPLRAARRGHRRRRRLRHRRARNPRVARAAGGRAAPQHGRSGAGSGRCRSRQAWEHRGRRCAADQRRWGLGARRLQRQGAFTHTAYNDYEIVADTLLAGAAPA